MVAGEAGEGDMGKSQEGACSLSSKGKGAWQGGEMEMRR